MIFRRRVLFTVGFPQPPEQLERAGQGEIVRLAVSDVSPLLRAPRTEPRPFGRHV